MIRAAANVILSAPSVSGAVAALIEAAGKPYLGRRVAMKGGAQPPRIIEEPLPNWLNSRTLQMHGCGGRDQVARTVWARGWEHYERPLPSLFARLAKRSRTVLDIGANTGFYSLLAGIAGAAVISFEPIPAIADVLETNARANGLANVRVVRCAISDAPGMGRMFLPGVDQRVIETGASLNPDVSGAARDAIERLFKVTVDKRDSEIDVEVLTVDQVSAGRQIDLIKIDVETLEDKVLKGAQATIAQCKPIIFVEVSKPIAPIAGYKSISIGSIASAIQDSYNQLLCPAERVEEISALIGNR